MRRKMLLSFSWGFSKDKFDKAPRGVCEGERENERGRHNLSPSPPSPLPGTKAGRPHPRLFLPFFSCFVMPPFLCRTGKRSPLLPLLLYLIPVRFLVCHLWAKKEGPPAPLQRIWGREYFIFSSELNQFSRGRKPRNGWTVQEMPPMCNGAKREELWATKYPHSAAHSDCCPPNPSALCLPLSPLPISQDYKPWYRNS